MSRSLTSPLLTLGFLLLATAMAGTARAEFQSNPPDVLPDNPFLITVITYLLKFTETK